MYECPYCGFEEISETSKLKASSLSPFVCPSCNQLSYTQMPWIEHLATWLYWPLAIAGLFIIVLYPLWGTLAIILSMFVFVVISKRSRKRSPLKPISKKRILASRIVHYSLLSFILFGMIYGFFLME